MIARAAPRLPQILGEIKDAPTRPFAASKYPTLVATQQDAIEYAKSADFLLTVRALFLCLSSLAIVFVWLAARRLWPDSLLAATAAAAFLGLSFQFDYHARFAAVDALQVACAALGLVGLAMVARDRTPRGVAAGIMLAGVAGGLSLGCKLTGAFMVFPVVVAAALAPGDVYAGRVARLRLAVLGVAAFAVAFVVTTPGAALDPLRFVGAYFFERRNYQQAHGSTAQVFGVHGYLDLLGKAGTWALAAVPSHYVVIALPASAIALLGAACMLKRERAFFAAACAGNILFMLFLASTVQLIVRNLLFLLPVFAIAFGAGVDELRSRFVRPAARGALLAALCAAAVANALWLYRAALSVGDVTPTRAIADATAYLRDAPDDAWAMSDAAAAALASGAGLVCTQTAPPPSARVVVLSGDVAKGGFRANHFHAFDAFFSARDVDLDWYPTWGGHFPDSRILVIARANAQQMRFDKKLDELNTCVRDAR